MHVGQERMVKHAARADDERFAERFTDTARGAAENDKIPAATDRPALDHGNGRLLQDRVGGKHAVGDAAEFDNRDGGIYLHHPARAIEL